MKLSDNQYRQLLTHVKTKWQSPADCPVCRNNDWDVPTLVYELREFHGGNMVLGSSSIIPVSPITCKVCGNTVLINPLIAGVDLKKEIL